MGEIQFTPDSESKIDFTPDEEPKPEVKEKSLWEKANTPLYNVPLVDEDTGIDPKTGKPFGGGILGVALPMDWAIKAENIGRNIFSSMTSPLGIALAGAGIASAPLRAAGAIGLSRAAEGVASGAGLYFGVENLATGVGQIKDAETSADMFEGVVNSLLGAGIGLAGGAGISDAALRKGPVKTASKTGSVEGQKAYEEVFGKEKPAEEVKATEPAPVTDAPAPTGFTNVPEKAQPGDVVFVPPELTPPTGADVKLTGKLTGRSPEFPTYQKPKLKPEVPATAPDPRQGMSAIEEIRSAGARTRKQVQDLFPQLSNEEAAALRRAAWREDELNALGYDSRDIFEMMPEEISYITDNKVARAAMPLRA